MVEQSSSQANPKTGSPERNIIANRQSDFIPPNFAE